MQSYGYELHFKPQLTLRSRVSGQTTAVLSSAEVRALAARGIEPDDDQQVVVFVIADTGDLAHHRWGASKLRAGRWALAVHDWRSNRSIQLWA